MEPIVPLAGQDLLDALRARRADLRGSMSMLEQTLAAPAPGRPQAWAQRVHRALGELSADFDEHIDITEGPDGLYRELLTTAPRLSKMVARLTREHGQVRHLLDQLQAHTNGPQVPDVDRIRDIGTTLLGRLAHHRQRGADLVFEAYSVDLGGET
jgi:hemerythrin HHE cation binding domain-containing protein